MKNRTTEIIYGYWNEVRRGRLAPRRFDIEPARIAGVLAETMILERTEDDDTLRFRLAGTRIAEQFGMELRGRNFLDLWTPDKRASLAAQIRMLRQQGGVLLLEIEARTVSDRAVTMEAVLLPLVHTRDEVDRFLGAISCSHAPIWLGTEPLVTMHLLSNEIIWPDGRPHEMAAHPAPPPALSSALSSSRIVRFDRRQFRVLDGGKLEG